MLKMQTTILPRNQKKGRKPKIFVPETKNDVVLQTFNYNFTEKCKQILSMFALEHREDPNKKFKMAWQQFIAETSITEILLNESTTLKNAGYEGDVMEKMYSSARYYYRKKALKDQTMSPENHKKPRKQYESGDSELLSIVNEHIIGKLFNGGDTSNITPAKAFEDFCDVYENVLDEFYENKYKKIYKNRFFVLRKKYQEQRDK